jgi:hypothetical protein
MPLKPLRGRPTRFLLPWLLLGLLGSTGCATPAPVLTLPTPASLRAPCPRPARPTNPTVGDLAAFSVNQEAALSICDDRRSALVSIADAYNKAVGEMAKPRKHWKLF